MDKKERIEAFVIAYSDSAFTNPHTVVLPDEAKDCRNDFTHMGVKYSGLETRRHKATKVDFNNKQLIYNHQSHNWIKIGLKQRTTLSEVIISTRWFTGNQVRAVSLIIKDELTNNESVVLTRQQLDPDTDHKFSFTATIGTECLLKLYYEGGISRISFYGLPTGDQLPKRINLLETAVISHVSDEHYGNPSMAVNGNRKEMHMVGWESARTGFGEQALFHLSNPAMIEEIVVDTYLHRLNAPLTCHIYGLQITREEKLEKLYSNRPRWALIFEHGEGNNKLEIVPDNFQDYMLHQRYLQEPVSNPTEFRIELMKSSDSRWLPILPFEALCPDTYHRYTDFENSGLFTHLLYIHYPNGGVHGLKVYGKHGGM